MDTKNGTGREGNSDSGSLYGSFIELISKRSSLFILLLFIAAAIAFMIAMIGLLQSVYKVLVPQSLISLVPIDFGNLGIFASVASLMASFFIAAWSVNLQKEAKRSQEQADTLQEYLYRSWPGAQTDYGAGLVNNHSEAPSEVLKHVEDIEKTFSISPQSNLDSATFMLSSLAYGIEHSPKTLERFINVLFKVINHQHAQRNEPTRVVQIAIWPLLEHQIIWGASREEISKYLKDLKLTDAPAIRAMTREKSPWFEQVPSWCGNEERFNATIQQLRRFCKFFKACEAIDRVVQLEITEIEPWSCRAFFNKYGRDETASLLIVTTPINSSVLSSKFFTTIGFHSENLTSYNQLAHIYNICAKSRYNYSEATVSNPITDKKLDEQNADYHVRKTKQFIEEPEITIAKYFLLDMNWKDWTRQEQLEFFDKIHAFKDFNKKKNKNQPEV